MSNEQRETKIVRVSALGIAANVVLAALKATVGLLSASIAIVLDAVNNLSDALSSVITIIGAKLSGKRPDRKHPFGHGRYEYLAATVISVLVLYAGVTSLVESIKAIIEPTEPDYKTVFLFLVGAAVAVKVALGFFVKRAGKTLQSDALANSGEDALMDAVISASTLVAALVYVFWQVSLEAWLGVVIALFIIKSGIGMLWRTVSKLLGERVEGDVARAVKETICATEGVIGAYDLVLNNYGPDRWLGSVHIEVPDTWTADKIDVVSRDISYRVAKENHVIMAAIGVYSQNSTDDAVREMRTKITEVVMGTEHVLQIHGFYCDTAKKLLRFDVVVSFTAPDAAAVVAQVQTKIGELYPDYVIHIQQDADFSD